MPPSPIPGATVSVGVPPPFTSLGLNADDWKSFQFHVHDFASLDSTKGNWVLSPKFFGAGHQWLLEVFPGGTDGAKEDKLSIYLRRYSEAPKGDIAINFQVDIIDKLGENRMSKTLPYRDFPFSMCWGWKNFISRSDTLNRDVIGSDGALNIVVSIKEEQTDLFLPENSAAKKMGAMFNDEATADVCFEVANASHTTTGTQKKQKSSVSFHAHRLILSKFAPLLAELVATSDKFTITDVKPDVFRHLLYYVYGGEVPTEELKKHARDIIEAADKYAIVNLKLTAEAAYVESTDITIDNAIDNLLYADGKNCALLKEKVMNFLADHPNEAAEKISFENCPPHVMKDLLIAFGRKDKNDSSAANVDELSTLSVSAIRRKLHLRGMEVDGSREAMIESLKKSSANTSGERD